MTYTVKTLDDSGSGLTYTDAGSAFARLTEMAANCEMNGGTYFNVTVFADKDCEYDPIARAYNLALDIRDGKKDNTFIEDIIGYLGEALE